ncbi:MULTISPECIES: TIGR00730 family Rossman fold protein [unclassified Haematobacter]|uniref:LOG family protein n=1 Tax=unclassified Haematobacter TaxID=2640585 RepID=UPI0025B991AF|nr:MULTISPECIES: TIGR00730 family Rossman fold protein [unclassified Haematobacter]
MARPEKSVCVFCGARPGTRAPYATTAAEMGRMLAEQNWRLVYGAGDVGLMGEVARAAQMAGAETFGVIPEHLVKWEVGKRDLSTYIVTSNMHERKTVMYQNSDAVVVLPGGIGTLDEFFEVLTWRYLKLHDKPIFILNVEGFWDPLARLIDQLIGEGFAGAEIRDFYTVVPDVPRLAASLRAALA